MDIFVREFCANCEGGAGSVSMRKHALQNLLVKHIRPYLVPVGLETGTWIREGSRRRLGPWLWVRGSGSVALGPWLWVRGSGSVALGPWLWVRGSGSVALGPWLWVRGSGSVALV
ncbi:uncharacterized protein LOC144946905 [Lampetra fluviatilis]